MARFTYTSTEDGQVIESAERIDHLEGLARWIVEDAEAPEPEAPVFTGDSMIEQPNPIPVAGPVNLEPVTGGNPPLVSAGAGFSNPSEIITQEEAERLQAAALAANAPKPDDSPEEPTEIPEGEPTDKWSVAAIKAYADREGINLDGAKNKGEYLEVIAKQ